MTEQQHAAASKILSQIKEFKTAKSLIENAIEVRKREQERSRYGYLAEWINSAFAIFRMGINGDKASVAVRYECSRPVEFPVDEQFVSMILGYLDTRIKEKEQELEAM